jgi:hypothetical protein
VRVHEHPNVDSDLYGHEHADSNHDQLADPDGDDYGDKQYYEHSDKYSHEYAG